MKFFKFFIALIFFTSPVLAGDFKLEYIGEEIIPWNKKFEGTIIGGLSGIDYDAKNDKFVVISDDRAQKGKARFYEITFDYDLKSIGNIQFKKTHFLKNAQNEVFKKPNLLGRTTVDPESIRLAADGKSYFWSSEGDVRAGLNPEIFQMNLKGDFIANFEIPKHFLVSKDEKTGIRNNAAFEAMTLNAEGKNLIVMTEGPLFQDGMEATVEHGASVRITRYDIASKKMIAEYRYKIDPVHKKTLPIDLFSVNGAVEILNITGSRYLVMERSFAAGRGLDVRLYEIDLKNIKNNLVSVPKKLIANLTDFGIMVDNVEGMSFGKNLADGRRSLIFISDNNFRGSQKTQFLLFAISSSSSSSSGTD